MNLKRVAMILKTRIYFMNPAMSKLIATFYIVSVSSILLFLLYYCTWYLTMHGEIRMITEDVGIMTTKQTVDQSDSRQFVLETAGCVIKRVDPWDPAYREYFYKIHTPVCPVTPNETLVYIKDGYLRIDMLQKSILFKNIIEESVGSYNIAALHLTCRQWAIVRNQTEDDESFVRISHYYRDFNDSMALPTEDEHLKVECYVNGPPQTVFHHYFFSPVKKSKVESECKENEQKFLKEFPNCTDRPNILILGIDSISKANFLRQLPLTAEYIQSNLEPVDFQGYNKVGLNTFPCLTPLIMGQSEDEIRKGCWGGENYKFDNCTTLMDIFAAAGYRTAFYENWDYFGLFSYLKKGFKRQPTHYYGKSIFSAMVQNIKTYYTDGCIMGKHDDEMIVEWAYEFQKAFRDVPHYGHFWTCRFTHNYLNEAQLLDPLFLKFFRKVNIEGLLNNTVLIFMSDHGLRYGEYRETDPGALEENLPFLYLIFPSWFRKQNPKAMINLEYNVMRLVTTFDLHKTILSILHCDYNNMTWLQMSNESGTVARGTSLFQKISEKRTCIDADVPLRYCACTVNTSSDAITFKTALTLGKLVVEALNNLTSEFRDVCAVFKIQAVLQAKEIYTESFDNLRHTHLISVLTTPGDCKFEANIIHDSSTDTYMVDPNVRRINAYGTTSWCVAGDGRIKSICYCKVQH